MATVRPFQGLTFDPTRVPDPALVTCPPYDVISPDDRENLYGRHPYNIVRIVSGRDEGADHDAENKYTRACGFFRSWVWEGVLREDPQPAFYVYRQAFSVPGGGLRRVWGMLATISLDDPILAHEHTMSGPKADRLSLMRAVPANLSPIYALYAEDGGGISAGLQEWAGEPPVADFVDDEATRHTVWAAHDEALHAKVATALAPSPLLIADGHHRFETSKIYRDERRAAAGAGPWDHVMALLVDAGVQPVCILPYHRIVRRCDAPDPLVVLERTFEVTEIGPVTPSDAGRLGLDLWDEPREGVFVAFVGDRAYRLVAPAVGPDEIPAGILKRLGIEPLGIPRAEDFLSFTPRAEEVAAEAAAGRAVCGFLIQPVSVDRVWRLASTGAQMPEKSTYFHPKPRDGIVIRALEPCDRP